MAPPPQRPFFANFLAVFRAHSASPSSNPSAAARSLSSKTQNSTVTSTSTAANTATRSANSRHLPSSARCTTTQPISMPSSSSSAVASNNAGPTAASSQMPYQAALGSTPETAVSAATRNTRSPVIQASRRRGSDSSSEGFRDVLGAEKWYIGGRTGQGEERYYRLSVVRRRRSGGSLSLDRLSL